MKKLWSIWIPMAVIVLGICLLQMPVQAAEILGSGTMGDGNTSWVLDADGVLTIDGSGEMVNYFYHRVAPWEDLKSSIKTVVLMPGITTIGDCAFYECSNLKAVTIPEGVTRIGQSAFEGCNSLTSITIPKTVTSIWGDAFYGCRNLKSLHITSLNAWLKIQFGNCYSSPLDSSGGTMYINGTAFTGGTIYSDVPANAFSGCQSLEFLYFNGEDIHIGDYAFYGCKNLSFLDFDGVSSVGSAAFAYCQSLDQLTMCDSLTELDSTAFFGCTSLNQVWLSKGLTSIGNGAFRNCVNLAVVGMPEALQYIGANAFEGCAKLKSIRFGKNLQEVGSYAFSDCTALCKISFQGGAPTLGSNCFQNVNAAASYPCLESSWTEETCQLYGAKELRWTANHSFDGTTCTLCNQPGNLWFEIEYLDCPRGWYNNSVVVKADGVEILDYRMSTPNLIHIEIPYDPYVSYTFLWFGDIGCEVSIGQGDHYYLWPSYSNFLGPILELPGLCRHSFENGLCTLCGEAEPDYLSTIQLQYPTLSFENEIFYNIYYTLDNAAHVVDMGLITFDSSNADGTIDDAAAVIPGYVSSETTYMARTQGIPAKELGDTLYFKVYARLSDGSYVYSDIAGYNAVTYAQTVLNSPDTTDSAKALVVAMLNYGAAAQSYFQHRADDLMNAGLTVAQQGLVQSYSDSMVAPVEQPGTDKCGSFVHNGGYIQMIPSVSFEGSFSIHYRITPKYTPDEGITFYYWDAETYRNATELTADNATTSVRLADGSVATVEGIAARQLDEGVYVAAVYSSGGVDYYTPIASYSLGAYCKAIAAKGIDIGAATAVYGYYAKTFFS